MAHKNAESKTRSERATRALRLSERDLRNIITNSADGIVITDETGRIKLLNSAAEVMLGRKTDPVLGTVLTSPITAGEAKELEVVSGNQERTVLEMRIVEIEWEGKRAFLGTMRDITERKAAMEQIQKQNRDLKTRISQLEAANRELDSFNYTVSHDLRKPLTIINGYCQELIEECSDVLSQQCRDYLVEIYNGTVRMNELINALLDYTLLSRRELQLTDVDLTELAETIAAQLTLTTPQREVTFKIMDGMRACGDADLLEMVLQKLFDNAWKYTAVRKHGEIEFGVTESDDEMVFFVRDNGAGFNQADAEKLFIPFQSLSVTDEKRGHRLGLATVSRIVNRHGGRIWAVGKIDTGATFYFTLPSHQGSSA